MDERRESFFSHDMAVSMFRGKLALHHEDMRVAARSLAVITVLTVMAGCSSGPATLDAKDSLPLGATAPFSVYTHCGFQFAVIDGETWRTRLRDDGHGNAPRGWPVSVTGNIERISETRAVF